MHDRLRVQLEIKSLGDRQFEGYGAVFKNVDYGGDVIVPGAFNKSLAAQDHLPPMFWMHQPDQIPGKWLSMTEDKYGLLVKGELADTQLGRETHTLLKMEAVRGMSIGYMTVKDEFRSDGVRLLKELDLIETSIVSLPMNPLAQVSAVKTRLSVTGEYVPTPRELEKEFRRIGCSKSASRRMISKIYDGSGETLEPDEEETGETLVESQPDRCEADEEAKLIERLQELSDSLLADRVRRKLKVA